MSNMDREANYSEATRLLRSAAALETQGARMQPGDTRREALERQQTHAERRAQTHALLAGIDMPERTTSESEPEVQELG